MPITREQILADYRREGAKACREGAFAKPPLRDEECAAWWDGYRREQEAAKKTKSKKKET